MRGLSQDEDSLLRHNSMWGSNGHPINKLRNGWTWGPWKSIQGPPTVFKTKREAVASFERFIDVLIEAAGEQAQARYFAEHPGSEAAYRASLQQEAQP